MTVPGVSGTPLTEGRVLMAANPDTTAHTAFAAWRVGFGNWQVKYWATELLHCRAFQVRPITPDLWFVMGFAHQSDLNDAANRIMKTPDGGVTWAAFTQPKSGNDYWVDFRADAGGRLWGLTLDYTTASNGIAKLWYSDDGGTSWTLSNTWTGSGTTNDACLFFRIACHPTNQNIIAIEGATLHGGVWAGPPVVANTINRGASWTTYTPNEGDQHFYQNLGMACGLVMTPSNRLILTDVYTSGHMYIVSSDDLGQGDWTVRKDFGSQLSHRVLGPAQNLVGTGLYVEHHNGVANTFEIWYSLDQGATWLQFATDVPDPGYSAFGGLATNQAGDTLYVMNSGQGGANNLLIVKMGPPDPLGSDWQDFSDSMLPIGGLDSYFCSQDCNQIEVIPN